MKDIGERDLMYMRVRESHLFNLCALVLGEIGIQKLNTDQALGLHFWNNGSDIRKENQGEGLRLNVALVAQQTVEIIA